MNNIAIFSQINNKVEKIFTEEKPESKGLAFTILCLRLLFKLNADEVEETITDGPMDGEVDAIFISERVVHLLTFKYTDNFDLSNRSYPEGDLDQFILTMNSIIDGSLDHRVINDAVWEKYQEIRNLSSTGKVDFKIHIISNKLYPAAQAKHKLENAIKAFTVIDPPNYMGQEDLIKLIHENKAQKIDGVFHFIQRQHFEKSDGNIKTIIGAISAQDLINIIIDPVDHSKINEQVFNENVRTYKPHHRVNKSIIESAQAVDNHNFFYLNNGITILCDVIDYLPNSISPVVKLENLQIINGGQTSHSLFEVFKASPQLLPSVELLVRICKVSNDDPVSQRISATSNNQIPVGSRDLHSNDDIQRTLEDDFETLGYYYESKPNKHDDKPIDKILSNEVLGQLVMAYHLAMPSEAKNNKTKVFAELYDAIFDERSVTAPELLRLYKLYIPLLEKKKEIQIKRRKKQTVPDKEAFVSRATFHILYGTRFLFEKAQNKIISKKISQQKKQKLIKEMYESMGDKFIKESTDMIFDVVKKQMAARGKDYTHDKFFKEIPTNNIIRTHILNKIKKKKAKSTQPKLVKAKNSRARVSK